MADTILSAESWPFISNEEEPKQPVSVRWNQALAGKAPPAEITVDGERAPAHWREMGAGQLAAMILRPLSAQPHRVAIEVAGHRCSCEMERPRDWQMFVVPHSHVDIGYTEYQDILADAHGDYIAMALDLIAATQNRPDEERYRWTCETTWTIEQFLRRHPEREAEFVRRLKEGSVEMTALYVNMTDLYDETLLKESLKIATQFRDRWQAPLTAACNYDVNGFGWALPRLLSEIGVQYLDAAINETRARGVRPRPRMFEWMSPTGESILL